MATALRVLVCTLLIISSTSATLFAKTLLVVFPFCPEDLSQQATLLFDSLKTIKVPDVTTDSVHSIGSFRSSLDINDDKGLTTIRKFADKRTSDYILFSELSHSVGHILIEYKLYSREHKNFISTSFDRVWYNDIENAVKNIETRLTLITQSKIIKIVNAVAVGDSSANQITVNYETYGDTSLYAIQRSLLRDGPYDTIATVSTTTYTDSDIQPGIVYWYKVQALFNGNVMDTSTPVSVYIELQNKENLDLDKVLSMYKKPEEKPADNEQKAIINSHIELIKPQYMNAVKLRIMMQIVK